MLRPSNYRLVAEIQFSLSIPTYDLNMLEDDLKALECDKRQKGPLDFIELIKNGKQMTVRHRDHNSVKQFNITIGHGQW